MPSFSTESSQFERFAHIEHSLLQAMKQYNVPGASIAIIDQYTVSWSNTYGVLEAGQDAPVQADSLFQACSISKSLTAVATLRLVQAGLLDLDMDVNNYLKSWQIPANETWQPTVTIRQLLSHTAGINVPWFYGYHRDQDVPSLIQILAGEKPANTPGIRVSLLPGTRFRYSGGGYCIVQQLLCDVRGQPFPELMRELVLDPIGMAHSTFEQPLPATDWDRAARGHRANGKLLPGGWHTLPEMAAAGLWTTATDLARFSIDLQSALAGQAERLLSPEMVRILLSPQVQREGAIFMGLGAWLEGTARFGHPGDNEGFASRWVALREGGMGAVLLANSDNGGELIADVVHTIEEVYGWPAVEGLPAPPPSVKEGSMACVGTYQFRSGLTCSITQESDELYLQTSDQPPAPLKAVSETVYILLPLEGEIIFISDEQGIVRGLKLRQSGIELEADKVS
jgi:CubicO group peptidase (beta-lactamase class C family)